MSSSGAPSNREPAARDRSSRRPWRGIPVRAGGAEARAQFVDESLVPLDEKAVLACRVIRTCWIHGFGQWIAQIDELAVSQPRSRRDPDQSRGLHD
jgi:hypothetical protein